MASKKDVEAGKAYVEMYLKKSQLVKGLRSVQSEFNALGKKMMTAGTWTVGVATAIAGPLLGMAQTFNSIGSNYLDMATRTGLAVEALSELGYAASQSGSDLAAVETSARKMHQFMATVERGSKDAAETLGELGFSLEQIHSMSPEDRFEQLGLAIAKVEDPGRRAAIAMQVFGKTGTALLPLFSTGAEGLAELREEARQLGVSMSTEDAEAAHKLGDAIDRVKAQLLGMTLTIGAALAPMLESLLGHLKDGIQVIVEFVRENAGMAVSLAMLAAAIGTAGAMLLGIGIAFKLAAFAAGALASMIVMVGGALAALTSPIGLAVAGLAALVAYLVQASGVGGQAVDWLKTKFGELYTELAEVFGVMGQLLAGGNMTAAARLLWAMLQMEWARGTAALKDIWIGFKYSMAEVFVDAWSDIRGIWTESIAALETLWIDFTDGFMDAWEGAQSVLAKGIAFILAKIEGLDPADVMADVERQYNLKSDTRDQANKAALDNIEAERTAKQEQIAADRAGAKSTLDDMRRDEEQAMNAQVDAARTAWEQAMAEARSAADKIAADKGPGGGQPEFEASAFANGGTIKSEGTFSAFAAAGLGSVGYGERMARGIERLTELQRDQNALAEKQITAIEKASPRFA